MNPLMKLQEWFANQCNGAWEHELGIAIETIDNPGWHLRIALTGTILANVHFETVEVSRNESDWYLCRLREDIFEGFGGPKNLDDIVHVFLAWIGVVSDGAS